MLNNTAATVYNRAVDQENDETKYHRTVLPAVHWEDGFCASDNGKNHAENRSVFVSIDFSACSGMEKQYLPAHQFARLPSSEQGKYWTLAIGDMLLKGSVADDIPDKGIRQFLANHPEVATITAVDTLDMGSDCMKHWEVTAR